MSLLSARIQAGKRAEADLAATRRKDVLTRLAARPRSEDDLRKVLGWPSGIGLGAVLRELRERGEAHERDGFWHAGPVVAEAEPPTTPSNAERAVHIVQAKPGILLSHLARDLDANDAALGRALREDPRFVLQKQGNHRTAKVTVHLAHGGPPVRPAVAALGVDSVAEAIDGAAQLRDELDKWRTEARALRLELDAATARAEAMANDRHDWQRRAEAMLDERDHARMELDAARSVAGALRVERDRVSGDCGDAERACGALRAELDAATARAVSWLWERDEARLELDAARAELALLRPTTPPPQGGHGDVWQELIDAVGPDHPLRGAMIVRRSVGITRYGQPLRRGDGRDADLDLREELLDAAAYAQRITMYGLPQRLLDIADDPRKWLDMQVGIEVQAGQLKTVEAELRRRLGKPADFVFTDSELVDAIGELANRVPSFDLDPVAAMRDLRGPDSLKPSVAADAYAELRAAALYLVEGSPSDCDDLPLVARLALLAGRIDAIGWHVLHPEPNRSRP